jgi:hypothetical protein
VPRKMPLVLESDKGFLEMPDEQHPAAGLDHPLS